MGWLASDGNLLARIVLTLATLGYSALTIVGDFNKTHATNPLWTPHARFHVVWQVSTHNGIGLIALALIWLAGPLPVERLYLAGALGVAAYGGFFAAAFSRSRYDGKFHDENGYQPIKAPIGKGQWDLNATGFTVLSLVLILGIALIR